jgi:arylsulfatase A-like enzyme
MITRRTVLRQAAAAAAPAFLHARSGSAAERPNILWIISEDLGPMLGCYGYPLVRTPNLDRLAAEGVRFTQAHTTGPVCSASRSAFNTGLYQTSIGAHHHRSHRKDGYRLPEGVRLVTDRFRDAGYFTANVLEIAPGVRGAGKTDFNFTARKPFDGTHWNQRPPGAPFFAQVNFPEAHKGQAFVEARRQKDLIDPAQVPLPPYYPDHPVVRDEVANYLDAINLLDRKVGVLLRELEQDKLLENTVIFFFGDNGRCLLRGKQWVYDAGTHVPLLARWPGVLKPASVREDPVIALDITAASLVAAGIALPEYFHGRPLFGGRARPREYVVTARDRCDMTVDRIRAVRDRRYHYLRNFMPERPYTQWNDYIEKQYPTLRVLKELHAQGKLSAVQALFMQPTKPPVEFYDTTADPHEVRNLASSPQHQALLRRFGRILDQWMEDTRDLGAIPETDSGRA